MRKYSLLALLICSLSFFLRLAAAERPFRSLQSANLDFAFKFYGKLKEPSKNLFFSPFSISTALSMTASGAANETKTEMLLALETNGVDGLEAQQKELLKKVNRLEKSEDLQLNSANSLWVSDAFRIKDTFADLVRENYLSEINSCDFIRSAENERLRINKWVSEKTNGKIANLLPNGSISALTRLVLVNAVYFYGKWELPFDPKHTKEDIFHLADGNEVKTSFMKYTKVISYYEDDNLQAAELNYKGNELSLLIVLPKSELPKSGDLLNSDYYNKIIASQKAKEVNVKIPKFKLESMYFLKDLLKKLGISLAFDQNKSDFSKIDEKNQLLISEVIHKAFIEVNEEGTEAAAATAVVMVGRSLAAPVQITNFIADKPFTFFIRDKKTNTILFMGELQKPN